MIPDWSKFVAEVPFVDKNLREWNYADVIGEQGGTATVFMLQSGREERAIKVYSPEFMSRANHADQLRRLEMQGRLIGKHIPGLVQTFEVDVHSFKVGEIQHMKLPYVLMEYVPGQSLHARLGDIQAAHFLPIFDKLYRTGKELLRNLAVAHRDIKPLNIQISDDFESITLLDLGIAKVVDQFTTDATASFVGTVRYSPPESLGTGVDYHSNRDAYAALTYYQLGAVLYSLIAGQVPYAQEVDPLKIKDLIVEKPLKRELEIKPFPSLDGFYDAPTVLDIAKACLTLDWRKRIVAVQDILIHRRGIEMGRKPTIIMLYTGGTIASKVDPKKADLLMPLQVESPEDPELIEISNEITSNYKETFLNATDVAPDLLWEILDREDQIFSENSEIGFLQVLVNKLQWIVRTYVELPSLVAKDGSITEEHRLAFEELKIKGTAEQYFSRLASKYILGVVVLHGTDTMSESAAHASLGMPDLPCSIVFTGANRNLDPLDKTHESNRDSDGWDNIRSSIYFLQALGHKVRDIFVCFGNRVHYPLNLAKSASEGMAISVDPRTQSLSEPFTYRNLGVRIQYAFRFIDDLICNNFYPINGFGYQQHVGLSWAACRSLTTFRHIRSWPGVLPKLVKEEPYSEWLTLKSANVICLPISVSMAEVVISEHHRCVLCIGYLSGSFPHQDRHPFNEFLNTAKLLGLPVFHVTDTTNLPGKEYTLGSPIQKLYGITPETALPLLTMVCAAISDEEWNRDKTQAARVSLIQSGVSEFIDRNVNVMTYILGDVGSVAGRRERILEWQNQLNEEYLVASRGIDEMTKALWRYQNVIKESLAELSQNYLSVSDAGDLLLKELDFYQFYRGAGSEPEYVATLFQEGYSLGHRRASHMFLLFTRSFRKLLVEGPTVYSGKEIWESMQHHIDLCIRVANLNGMGGLSLSVEHDLGQLTGLPSTVTFKGLLSDNFNLMSSFPTVSVAHMSGVAREWMADVRYRTVDGKNDDNFESEIAERYSSRLHDTWVDEVPAYYFLGLGYLKAIACCALHSLNLGKGGGRRFTSAEDYRDCLTTTGLNAAGGELEIVMTFDTDKFNP